MQIVEDRALVLRTRNVAKLGVIPKHKVLREVAPGIHEVAVRWGLDEARVLKNLGFRDVPSPILRHYDWPGRYKPMSHQRETASFLTMHTRAFVFNDPGTGKSITALWAADYLMKLGRVRRCLILCPMSVMHSAWLGDINNSIIHRSAIVAHHAQAARRIEMVQSDYEFVIMNYDGLPLVANEIIQDGRFDLVIVDEANHMKTTTTRRWKTLAKILKPDTLLWMMTGTPASQSPVDAFGLAKLVNPKGVPQFFGAWRDKVMYKVTNFKWAPKPDAKDTVFAALQPAIRFKKEQCLDLPPVLIETRDVPMTLQQAKYYKLIKEQMLAQVAGETISAVNKAVMVGKLLQISCGAVLTEMHEVVEFDCTPRLNTLLEVLEETDRKVLIFCLFRSSIDTVVKFLNSKGVTTGEIHGDINASKRGQLINAFQHTPEPRVLVMQPAAAAHGITLTAADTVIFYGPLMSVEQYTQCIARADRKGQTSNNVTVVHIQSSPIEEKMFKSMALKVGEHQLLAQLFDSEVKEFAK